MQSSHSLDRLHTTFDEPHLIAHAGLLLPATLAQHLGLPDLFDDHVDLSQSAGHAQVGRKAITMIGSPPSGSAASCSWCRLAWSGQDDASACGCLDSGPGRSNFVGRCFNSEP